MSEPKRAAALLYGPEAHHLDHLAPLCSLLSIPLIVTEQEIEKSAKDYYPDTAVLFKEYMKAPEEIVQNFDILFYCSVRDLFDEVFFFAQKLYNKKMFTIWCPHGNSDKGHTSYFMEALQKEEVALVYGEKMIDFFKQKKVFDQLKAYGVIGNMRYSYYKRHKEFYTRLIQDKIRRKLKKEQTTILYAPTWNDAENSSSFFDAASLIVKGKPSSYNLIVKLHPNLLLTDPFLIEEFKERYASQDDILVLENFPPIYPLLDFVDIYVGDMSSIGYDFLTFNKPMFFLNQNNRDLHQDLGLYLFRCGIEIKKEQYKDLYQIIDAFLPGDSAHFSSIRKEVYDYTFGKEKEWSVLKKEIESLYGIFPDRDLNFY